MQMALSIRTFANAARLGSVSGAARVGNISVAKASRLVRSLEHHVGAQLLNRTVNGLTLTEAGEALLHSACPLLDELEAALELVGTYDTGIRGMLRVHIRTILAHELLIPALPRLFLQYPDLSIDLIVSNQEEIDISARNIDIDITFRIPDSLELIAVRLDNRPTKTVLVGSPVYFERKGDIYELSDIVRHDCISYGNADGPLQWSCKDEDGQSQILEIEPKLITNNGPSMRQAALSGIGICFLPKWIVEQDLRDGKLVDVLPKFSFYIPNFEKSIHAVYPKSKSNSVKLKIFLNFLKDIFDQLSNN